MNPFDVVLEELKIPRDDLKLPLEEVIQKHPALRDGWTRQADYSRKLNEFVDKEKRYQSDVEMANRWRDWKKDAWDDEFQGTKVERQQSERIKELNSEVETLRTSLETDMDWDQLQTQIDGHLKTKGYVTKDELGAVARKEDLTKYVDQDSMNRGFAGVEYLFGSTAPLMFKHKDEFGEVINPLDVVKYANEHGFKDVEKAYEAMVAPRRQEISSKKHADEIEAARKAGEEAGAQKAAMGRNGQMPVDNGAPQMGHLQARLTRTPDEAKNDPIPENAELGRGQLGRMAAEAFRAEQGGKAA